jgi:anti-sigma28 factor (negative regulator of flagellin synthesis)
MMLDYNALVRQGKQDANRLNSAAEMRDLAQIAKANDKEQTAAPVNLIGQIRRSITSGLSSVKASRIARQDT